MWVTQTDDLYRQKVTNVHTRWNWHISLTNSTMWLLRLDTAFMFCNQTWARQDSEATGRFVSSWDVRWEWGARARNAKGATVCWVTLMLCDDLEWNQLACWGCMDVHGTQMEPCQPVESHMTFRWDSWLMTLTSSRSIRRPLSVCSEDSWGCLNFMSISSHI